MIGLKSSGILCTEKSTAKWHTNRSSKRHSKREEYRKEYEKNI